PTYWHQAPRRFFLKNYGPWYTALADAAFLLGFAACRVRRRIQRYPHTHPPHLPICSIRHTRFLPLFAVPAVENPSLAGPSLPPPGGARVDPLPSARLRAMTSISHASPRPPSEPELPPPIAGPSALCVRAPNAIDEQGRRWTIDGWAKDLALHLAYLS